MLCFAPLVSCMKSSQNTAAPGEGRANSRAVEICLGKCLIPHLVMLIRSFSWVKEKACVMFLPSRSWGKGVNCEDTLSGSKGSDKKEMQTIFPVRAAQVTEHRSAPLGTGRVLTMGLRGGNKGGKAQPGRESPDESCDIPLLPPNRKWYFWLWKFGGTWAVLHNSDI